jgi:hypothetical protein
MPAVIWLLPSFSHCRPVLFALMLPPATPLLQSAMITARFARFRQSTISATLTCDAAAESMSPRQHYALKSGRSAAMPTHCALCQPAALFVYAPFAVAMAPCRCALSVRRLRLAIALSLRDADVVATPASLPCSYIMAGVIRSRCFSITQRRSRFPARRSEHAAAHPERRDEVVSAASQARHEARRFYGATRVSSFSVHRRWQYTPPYSP